MDGVVRVRPDQEFQREEDFSVSLINLALDGSPIHQDGIFGEQVISIPWDYASLGLSVIVKEKDLMRKNYFVLLLKGIVKNYWRLPAMHFRFRLFLLVIMNCGFRMGRGTEIGVYH